MGNSNSRRRIVNVSEDTDASAVVTGPSEISDSKLLAESLVVVGEKFVAEVNSRLVELEKLTGEKVVSKITRSKMLKIVDDISKMFEQMETWTKENSPSTNVDRLQDYQACILKIPKDPKAPIKAPVTTYIADIKKILDQICEIAKSLTESRSGPPTPAKANLATLKSLEDYVIGSLAIKTLAFIQDSNYLNKDHTFYSEYYYQLGPEKVLNKINYRRNNQHYHDCVNQVSQNYNSSMINIESQFVLCLVFLNDLIKYKKFVLALAKITTIQDLDTLEFNRKKPRSLDGNLYQEVYDYIEKKRIELDMSFKLTTVRGLVESTLTINPGLTDDGFKELVTGGLDVHHVLKMIQNSNVGAITFNGLNMGENALIDNAVLVQIPDGPYHGLVMRSWPGNFIISIVITKITFWNCEITVIPDNFLSDLRNLTYVNLYGLRNVTKIGNKFMYKCLGIVELDTDGFQKVNSVGDDFMLGCETLETFNGQGFSSVTSLGSGFMGECIKLKKLDTSMFKELKNIGRDFMKNCSSLETIDLGGLIRIGNPANFVNFLTGCRALTMLNGYTAKAWSDTKFTFFPTIRTSILPDSAIPSGFLNETLIGEEGISIAWRNFIKEPPVSRAIAPLKADFTTAELGVYLLAMRDNGAIKSPINLKHATDRIELEGMKNFGPSLTLTKPEDLKNIIAPSPPNNIYGNASLFIQITGQGRYDFGDLTFHTNLEKIFIEVTATEKVVIDNFKPGTDSMGACALEVTIVGSSDVELGTDFLNNCGRLRRLDMRRLTGLTNVGTGVLNIMFVTMATDISLEILTAPTKIRKYRPKPMNFSNVMGFDIRKLSVKLNGVGVNASISNVSDEVWKSIAIFVGDWNDHAYHLSLYERFIIIPPAVPTTAPTYQVPNNPDLRKILAWERICEIIELLKTYFDLENDKRSSWPLKYRLDTLLSEYDIDNLNTTSLPEIYYEHFSWIKTIEIGRAVITSYLYSEFYFSQWLSSFRNFSNGISAYGYTIDGGQNRVAILGDLSLNASFIVPNSSTLLVSSDGISDGGYVTVNTICNDNGIYYFTLNGYVPPGHYLIFDYSQSQPADPEIPPSAPVTEPPEYRAAIARLTTGGVPLNRNQPAASGTPPTTLENIKTKLGILSRELIYIEQIIRYTPLPMSSSDFNFIFNYGSTIKMTFEDLRVLIGSEIGISFTSTDTINITKEDVIGRINKIIADFQSMTQ
jgi:hypothetical protein